MQFFTTVATLALPLLALAAPAADAEVDASKGKKFLLKAQVPKATHPEAHSKFDGRYLNIYHTGAGLNDAQLTVEKPTNGFAAYFNGTDLLVTQTGLTYPYGVQLPTKTQYTSWQAVEINGGPSGVEFYNSKVGIQAKGEFGSFLACDWWHGVPQVFWYNKYFKDPLSQNCEKIYLIPEYL